MMVVSDIEDVLVPLVDGFLVSPQEARTVIDRCDFKPLLPYHEYHSGNLKAIPGIYLSNAQKNLLTVVFTCMLVEQNIENIQHLDIFSF